MGELVKAVAAEFAHLGNQVVFVTGGLAGVQRCFAENCGDGSRTWNLLPVGHQSSYSEGTDVHAGDDLCERRQVFGQLGDIYITIGGGPGSAQEARAADKRGAGIVPVVRSGGASSGMFDFPSRALRKPAFV